MNDHLRKLKLIVRKADKLANLSFTRYLREGGSIGFSGEAVDGGFVFRRDGPNDEAIDALALTLRFFIQNNEPTSLRNIEKLFLALPLERARIDAVSGSRRVINEYLDGPSMHVIRGNRLTRREIFEVFLWGDLAHANSAKQETYDSWAESEAGFLTLQMEFTDIVVTVLNAIFWFRDAAQELRRRSGSDPLAAVSVIQLWLRG